MFLGAITLCFLNFRYAQAIVDSKDHFKIPNLDLSHVINLTRFQVKIIQRRLDPGKEGRKGFFQVRNHKEYQNVVIISFVHLEKINIFCFMN